MNFDSPEVTPELKNLLINFVGQTYGEMHKLDKDIVQTAKDLQPTSELLKSRASSIINSIAPQRAQQQQFSQPVLNSSPVPQVEGFTPLPQFDPNQLEFNFSTPGVGEKLLNVVSEINTNLQRVVSSLDVLIEKLSQ